MILLQEVLLLLQGKMTWTPLTCAFVGKLDNRTGFLTTRAKAHNFVYIIVIF